MIILITVCILAIAVVLFVIHVATIELQYHTISKSIDKWWAIVYDNAIDNSTADCACCKHYFDSGCMGCPIAEFSNDTNSKAHLIWLG